MKDTKDTIFKNITAAEREKMFECMGAVKRRYAKGETICRMNQHKNFIGILISGRANITCMDFEGHISVFEQIGPGEIFGEMFWLAMEEFEFSAAAETDCDVRFVSFERLITPCSNTCTFHCELINNLFCMAAKKARELTMHVNILSRRTIRLKLLTYFDTLKHGGTVKTVTLPFSYTALADYICADRSAMMRELKKMRLDGQISVSGRNITLNYSTKQ